MTSGYFILWKAKGSWDDLLNYCVSVRSVMDCFNQSFLFLKHLWLVYKQLNRDIYLWDYSKGKPGCDLTLYLNAIKSSLYPAEPSNCLKFGKVRIIFKFEWNVTHSKMQWSLFTFIVQSFFFSLAPPLLLHETVSHIRLAPFPQEWTENQSWAKQHPPGKICWSEQNKKKQKGFPFMPFPCDCYCEG